VTDVTTRSVVAYRMHEQGVDAFFRADFPAALRLFDRALAEDSLFALAAYYGALAASTFVPDSYLPRLQRAQRLAVRAPDRERLTILADWQYRASIPTLRQVAETLATRYPAEVEGHLYTGMALVNEGEFLAARRPLERVIAMDSLVPRRGVTCGLCNASASLVASYLLTDSMAAAERAARRWLRLQPGSPPAIDAVINVLDREGKVAEADSIARVARTDQSYDHAVYSRVFRRIRVGDYDAADRLLAAQIQQGSVSGRANAYWGMVVSLREQGRLDEALDAARHIRPIAQATWAEGPVSSMSVIEALVQLDRGQPAVAAALFDSVVQAHSSLSVPSQLARDSAWRLTHVADAVEHSEIAESPSEIIFTAPKMYQLFLKGQEFEGAVRRVAGRAVKLTLRVGEAAAVAKKAPEPAKTDEASERALAHPEVKRFQELFPESQVRAVRNLKESET